MVVVSSCLQIDRQLQLYLHRVEAVLGKGWEVHVEGQKLKQDGEAFRQKLNTQQLFEDWKKKVRYHFCPSCLGIFAVGFLLKCFSFDN